LINVIPGETKNTEYRVRAITPCGYAGPLSEPLYVEFGPAPPQQTDVTVTAISECELVVNWNVQEVDEFPITSFRVDI
jgi:hypothetical protein